MGRLRKIAFVFLAIVVAVIAFRALLPEIIKNQINEVLANRMENYVGQIDDFDLSLWRGAYQIQGLELRERNSKAPRPLLRIDEIDISVSWRALLKGMILADLIFFKPMIIISDSEDEQKKQDAGQSANWTDIFRRLIPFRLASIRVTDGGAQLENLDSLKAPVLLNFTQIEIVATNIHNLQNKEKTLYSKLNATAQLQDQAALWLAGSFDLNGSFDFDAKLDRIPLVALNPIFKAYGPFDANKGTLEVYAELALEQSRLRGYVKPLLTDVDIIASQEQYDRFKKTRSEIVVGLTGFLLKNARTRSVATVFEISGDLAKPEIDIWGGIWLAVKNSFGEPQVKPGFDFKIQRKEN